MCADGKPFAIMPELRLDDTCFSLDGASECPLFEWTLELDMDPNGFRHTACVQCRHLGNDISHYFILEGDPTRLGVEQDEVEKRVREEARMHISRTCPYRVK